MRARAPDRVVRRREWGGRVSVLIKSLFWRGEEEREEGCCVDVDVDEAVDAGAGVRVRLEGKCGVWKGGDWVGCRREPDRVEGSV